MKYKKGQVWEVSDRHGEMTIKLMEDVDNSKDQFFKAVILMGKKDYISMSYNQVQKESGKGTVGHVESFRTGLCTFKKKIKGEGK